MTSERFKAITGKYRGLRVGVVGDFCLDRYLEIAPGQQEISIETGLPVHNVVNVRAQPGGAGTIVNNLVALGVGEIWPVGFAGEDGEGYELCRALAGLPGLRLDYFVQTSERRTFTYCKPLVLEAGKNPRELSRLDQKNWTRTPKGVSTRLGEAVISVADKVDTMILLSQVDVAETGVLTKEVLTTVGRVALAKPQMVIVADSRGGFEGFPPIVFKMNRAELMKLSHMGATAGLDEIAQAVNGLAKRNGRQVFVTLAERGIVGAPPDGINEHVPARPVPGEIDVVGAGDAVTANLTVALAVGAGLREAMELAEAAASIVIRQLGTTGSASLAELEGLLFAEGVKVN